MAISYKLGRAAVQTFHGTISNWLKFKATSWVLNLIVPSSINTLIEEHDSPLMKAIAKPLIIEIAFIILVPTMFLLARIVELYEEIPKFKKLANIDVNDPNFEDNLKLASDSVNEVETRHAEGWRHAKKQVMPLAYYLPLKITTVGTAVAITHMYSAKLATNQIALIASVGEELATVFYETAADNYGLPHLPNYPDPKEINRNMRYDRV